MLWEKIKRKKETSKGSVVCAEAKERWLQDLGGRQATHMFPLVHLEGTIKSFLPHNKQTFLIVYEM